MSLLFLVLANDMNINKTRRVVSVAMFARAKFIVTAFKAILCDSHINLFDKLSK